MAPYEKISPFGSGVDFYIFYLSLPQHLPRVSPTSPSQSFARIHPACHHNPKMLTTPGPWREKLESHHPHDAPGGKTLQMGAS